LYIYAQIGMKRVSLCGYIVVSTIGLHTLKNESESK